MAIWCVFGASHPNTAQAVSLVPPAAVVLLPSPPPQPPPLAKQIPPPVLSALTAILTAQQLAPAPLSGTGASIEGVVVRAGSSQGLAGANVELTQLSSTSTATLAPPKLIVSDAE